MKNSKFLLEGKKIFLRKLILSDVSLNYVNWLNAPDINKFLESRFKKHTIVSVKNFIRKLSTDENIFFLAIIEKKSLKHIGNIKLDSINWFHSHAEIGILIGDKERWGKGYGTESILLLSKFAFKELKLNKLVAGAYESNIGSKKAFLQAGFHLECKRINQVFYNNKFENLLYFAKFNNFINSDK